MKKVTTIIVLLAIIIVGGFYLLKSNQESPTEVSPTNTAWVEVISPEVNEARPGPAGEKLIYLRELKTGDEISTGSTIQTNETGLATIYFPDGSVARIDSNTTLTIDEVSFDERNETLLVRIALASGRVWSKVVELLTPESHWEVKTSNAVVTVRGTAFGVEREGENTLVVGSQDEAIIEVIDPTSGGLLPETLIVVSPDNFVSLADKDIPDLRDRRRQLVAQKITDEIAARRWISQARQADQEFDELLGELRRDYTDLELRRAFRERLLMRRLELLQESIVPQEETPEETTEPVTETPTTPPTTDTQGLPSPPSEPALVPEPKSLEIVTKHSLTGIVEDDQIIFGAVLISSDGSRRSVTNEANWQVLGPIGGIVEPGLFRAKLSPSVSELGVGSGAVIATWQNPKTGQALLGKTAIFEVRANIQVPADRRG